MPPIRCQSLDHVAQENAYRLVVNCCCHRFPRILPGWCTEVKGGRRTVGHSVQRTNVSRRGGGGNGPEPRTTNPPMQNADLHESAFGKVCSWWPGAESNHRHKDFQSSALPTELPGQERAIIAGRKAVCQVSRLFAIPAILMMLEGTIMSALHYFAF